MKRPSTPLGVNGALPWLVLLTLPVWAESRIEDVQAEQGEIQKQLKAEQALFESLQKGEHSLLTLLDAAEQLARTSQMRIDGLMRQSAELKARETGLKAREAQVQQVIKDEYARVAPRLNVLYRLSRHDRLGELLSASDFAALIRRQRALKVIVQRDVDALETLSLLSRNLGRTQKQLERHQLAARSVLKVLVREQAVAQVRKARFHDTLLSVTAESNRASRMVADLEAQDKGLTAMIAEMKSTLDSGFAAKKGTLPFPAVGGMVEVAFGKVVNPRFNTVTVQKGLDIRAASGTSVLAVGAGTVVFNGWLKGYGNLLIIDHGSGFHSLLAHLGRSLVTLGASVAEGQNVGEVGDTGSLKGPYLYFEIRKQGLALDPLPWLSDAP